jgi:hypothetical protein
MIGTIRKHSKWLWIVIATLTIISFIYWGSATSRSRDRGGSGSLGVVDGVPVSREEYLQARSDIFLHHFSQTGMWPDAGSRSAPGLQRDIYSRLFVIRKLTEYNIRPDGTAVAQAANELLRSLAGGQNVPLDDFVKQVLGPQKLTAQDFQRFIEHHLGIQQLASVLGLSGKLITPQEARSLYERDFRELSAAFVLFAASNHLADVETPNEDALQQFYSARTNIYCITNRVQVSYVEFNFSDKFAEAEKALTNLNELVEMNFRRLGNNAARLGNTPQQARARIREQIIRREASRDAQTRADQLMDKILDMEVPDLALVAETNGFTVNVTKPFTREDGPAEFDGGPDFARVAFSLDTNAPVGGPVAGENALYVIALNRQIPPEIPPLETIRDRVEADYKFNRARTLALNEAEKFVSAATNALAHEKPFAAVCADAGVQPVALPPFSLSRGEIPQIEGLANPNAFKQTAFYIPVGQISDVLPIEQGGIVIYVQKQLPIDESRMNAELPFRLNDLRRGRQWEAFNEWFSREAFKALRNIKFEDESRAPGSADYCERRY